MCPLSLVPMTNGKVTGDRNRHLQKLDIDSSMARVSNSFLEMSNEKRISLGAIAKSKNLTILLSREQFFAPSEKMSEP
jgi:hypothetical protein